MKLVIEQKVYDQIMHWTEKATGEVSGLGKVVKENGVLVVKSAMLFKQENTASSTDLDASEISKAMYELRNEPGHLNWWWHSHVNMGVFWSGTDEKTIEEIGKNGWLVATVVNKKYEYLSAYFQAETDLFPEIYVPKIETDIVRYISQDLVDQWDADFDEKVTVKKFYNYTSRFPRSDYWNGKLDSYDYTQSGFGLNDQYLDKEAGEASAALSDDLEDFFEEKIHDFADDIATAETYEEAKNLLTQACRLIERRYPKGSFDNKALKGIVIDVFNLKWTPKVNNKKVKRKKEIQNAKQ